jgi:hypothetical protein
MNLCTIGPRAHRLMHRTVACGYCGAGPGEKCIGDRGRRLEDCHVDRKRDLATWRRDFPNEYRALRDQVAGALLTPDSPLKA